MPHLRLVSVLLLPLLACAAPQRSQDERMAWWRQARFGMFVHWGLYAIPAGAHQGKTDYGEWIRDSARIPIEEYDKLQAQWNPVRFEADAWAKAAKEAGMKYLVLTSKHHDGFCLFDSEHTEWDVMATPHGRDICRELASACRRHGVTFCLYHSIMDWHHDDYLPRRPWEAQTRGSLGARFDRYERYLHAQVTEIVTQYRPAVLWFDGEWEATWNHERGLRLFDLCRRLDPAMLVNNRVDVHRAGMGGFSASDQAVGDFATPEQEIPPRGMPGVDWESCMTMNRHWGWNANDTAWKSSRDLVRNLIDTASKGGNYLLNVGPKADGTFPEQATARLADIGRWMDACAESIHGTTANVFDATPWGRCTVRDGDDGATLYLHLYDPEPGQVLRLAGLQNKVRAIRILNGEGDVMPVVANMFDAPSPAYGVQLQRQDPFATVIALDLEGPLDVVRAPTIHAESARFVHGLTVDIAGTSPSAEVRFTTDGSEPRADSPLAVGSVHVEQTCTLKAAAFKGGRQASDLVERRFERTEPWPPVEAVAPRQGLRRSRRDAVWTAVPEPRAEGFADHGRASAVRLEGSPGENVALRFAGFLDVPAADLYRFALASDDGSKLWIDGQLVVDNDGPHGTVEQRGEAPLAAGLHTIEVVWWNRTGGAELELRWAAPGTPFSPLPPERLRH